MNNLNYTLKIKKILKYIIIFIIIYFSIRYISSNINYKETIIISSIASITFAILDIISPTIKINIIK